MRENAQIKFILEKGGNPWLYIKQFPHGCFSACLKRSEPGVYVQIMSVMSPENCSAYCLPQMEAYPQLLHY